MKSINQIISEAETQWKWHPRAISEDTLMDYKNNIMRWAKQKYGNYNNETYIKVIEEYYKDYLAADSALSDEAIEKQYKSMCELANKIISKHGVSQFEYGCIGQGWFDYMNWRINQEK